MRQISGDVRHLAVKPRQRWCFVFNKIHTQTGSFLIIKHYKYMKSDTRYRKEGIHINILMSHHPAVCLNSEHLVNEPCPGGVARQLEVEFRTVLTVPTFPSGHAHLRLVCFHGDHTLHPTRLEPRRRHIERADAQQRPVTVVVPDEQHKRLCVGVFHMAFLTGHFDERGRTC